MKRLLSKQILAQAKRKGLSNKLINKEFAAPSFRGVFSVDNVPRNIKKNNANSNFNSCIINLSKKGTRGSHFVTLICFPNLKIGHYLDPEGAPPFQELINSLLYKKLNLKKVYYNNFAFQNPGSSYCAYYCMYFILLYEAAGKPVLLNRLTSFGASKATNDNTLINNLIKIIQHDE